MRRGAVFRRESARRWTGHGARSESPVAALVNGEPITAAELEALIRRSSLSPRQALDRLEVERLLMEEAEKRGFDANEEVERVGEQAAVQQLLIEQVERAANVTDDEVAAVYEASRLRAERRASVHVLAKLDRGADAQSQREAEQFAREAIAAFAKTKDVKQVLDEFKSRKSKQFQVVIEQLPPYSREASLAAEFKEALFSQASTGVVPHPVRTKYGWHAIYITQIIAPPATSLQQAESVLRPRILLQKRTALMRDFLDKLRGSYKVVRNETAIEWFKKADLPALFIP